MQITILGRKRHGKLFEWFRTFLVRIEFTGKGLSDFK
nr:MAG TPA: hypothetical protein [Caudoviricetes sp.]